MWSISASRCEPKAVSKQGRVEHRVSAGGEDMTPPALRQVGDKGAITLKKVVVEELRRLHPGESLKNIIGQRAPVGGNMEKGQGHTPTVRIAMAGPVEFFSQRGLNPQLFCQLTSQAGRLIFAVFDFTAGEFPFQGVQGRSAPLADKQPGGASHETG